MAVIWVSEMTVKPEAGVEPNLTALALARLVPVIVTVVPPAIEPDLGAISVIEGAGWISALSSISLPDSVPLGATVAPSTIGGKMNA